MERIDGHMERGNVLMEHIDGHMERTEQEFQMSHQILADLLKQNRDSHREVLARFEDLGTYMNEQTQALMRIQSAVDPDDE